MTSMINEILYYLEELCAESDCFYYDVRRQVKHSSVMDPEALLEAFESIEERSGKVFGELEQLRLNPELHMGFWGIRVLESIQKYMSALACMEEMSAALKAACDKEAPENTTDLNQWQCTFCEKYPSIMNAGFQFRREMESFLNDIEEGAHKSTMACVYAPPEIMMREK